MKARRKIFLLYIFIFAMAVVPVFFGNTNYERNTLTVYACGKSEVYRDEYIEATDHLVAEEMHEYAVNAAPLVKAARLKRLVKSGESKKSALLHCYPLLRRFVEKLQQTYYKPALDSQIKFDPAGVPPFSISREAAGRKVDENALYADIYSAWTRGTDAFVTLKFIPVEPAVTAADNRKLTYVRGSFVTDCSSSGTKRIHNIALALAKIDGTRISSGEHFSFNETVGRRNEANGFETAKIISNGEYVDGIGGGVCQVSTTLYNAALLAGLSIDEAGSHSLPPSYVEPSFDAAVSFGAKDLRFTNDTGGDVFIAAKYRDGKITVVVYGLKNPYKIERKSVITSVKPVPEDKIIIDREGKYVTEEMESGETIRVRGAIAGFESCGYLIYYSGGKKVTERKIRTDVYMPLCGILAKKP